MPGFKSPTSDIADDHRVKIMEIGEDEEAVIRVRTKFHVSLVFSRMTIEVFEKDGVIYTRQEVNGGNTSDTQSVGEPEYDQDLDTQYLETQPDDWEDQFTTPIEEPREVVQMAGGHFDCVNEKHASRLEDLGGDIGGEALEFDSYLKEGETQWEAEMTESQEFVEGYKLMWDKEREIFGPMHIGKVIAIPDTQSPTEEY